MRILCADSLPEAAQSRLRGAGHDVVVEAELDADTLPGRLAQESFDVLVVRSTKVSDVALTSSPSLGLVVRAGAGTDNIDKEAASARGIYVSNVPGKNAIAVAELAMGLLLAVDRQLAAGVADLRGEQWNKTAYSRADGIYGKTLGLIGVGEIALELAIRCRAFGLAVVAIDKERTDEMQARVSAAGITLVPDLDALLGTADVVSLHVPRSPATQEMVNRDFLAKMKDDAILLNTARGELINTEALIEAMDTRGIRCGFDVWPDEPAVGSGDWRSPLAAHRHVVGSHHIGASTSQAQRAVADGTVAVIEAYVAGTVMNCVNISVEPAGDFTLTVRHFDKVGVLAKIFEALRAEGMNVQQMQNQIFSGTGLEAPAAVASINLLQEPSPVMLTALADDADVLAVSVAKNASK